MPPPVAPSPKWLICDGATISKTTYAALFALVGHTYATNPGGGNFTLPDFRGRLPIGLTPATTASKRLRENRWKIGITITQQSNHQHAGGDHTHSIPTSDSSRVARTLTRTRPLVRVVSTVTLLSGSITSAGVHSHSQSC